MKNLSIILSAILIAVIGAGLGIFGYKYLIEDKTEQKTEQTVVEEKIVEPVITPVIVAPPIDYSEKDLFDNCPGIKGYKTKPFYNDLLSALPPKEEGDNKPFYDQDKFNITDACYSEKLKKVILLAQTAYGEGSLGFKVTTYNTETKEFKKTEWPAQNVFPAPDVFGLRNGAEVELLADTKCDEVPFLVDSDKFCDKDVCNKSLYTYNLETLEIKKIKDEKYTPDLAFMKKNLPSFAEKYNLKCVLCKAKPEVSDIGSYWYPVAEKYLSNGFPQVFQADDCGGGRINEIFGVENGNYWPGARIQVRDPYNSELINVLKSIGFTCSTLNPEGVCTEWELSKTVKVIELLKLKPFYKLFELLDCINCG